MAISIELWTNDGLVGGTERWWDAIEAWLPEPEIGVHDYPLISRVDPYGNAIFQQVELAPLVEELRQLAVDAPASVVTIADELISLCDAGLASTAAELRFVGD